MGTNIFNHEAHEGRFLRSCIHTAKSAKAAKDGQAREDGSLMV